ncbi:MAG: PAS domain S-box protein [Elusimicrobia bacterium]|nr:PAS domain S-box protein [Elusimicrobiota bacterium]
MSPAAAILLRIVAIIVLAQVLMRLILDNFLPLPPAWGEYLLSILLALAFAVPLLYHQIRREIRRRTEAETELRRRAESQSALHEIARLSFGDLPLEEFLSRALDRILAVEWLGLGRKGMIFSADQKEQALLLRACRGLEADSDVCTRVAFGECVCGRAAGSRTVVTGGEDDPEHRRRHPCAVPHGHCAVPILQGDLCLGVLQVNLKPGQPCPPEAAAFLQAVAGLVAGILARGAAEEERNRLATAIEQATESVIITDPRGLIQYVNPAFTRSTGYARSEAMGQTPRLLKSGRHGPELYETLWRTIRSGNIWEGRLTDRRKDGALFENEITITPVKENGGNLVNYVAVCRDITVLSALEEQMRRSQKMEAVGLLAGGIAHDFNNVLTTIVGYNYFIMEALEPGHPLRAFSQEIRRSAELAGSLTHQLLALGRHQIVQPRVMDANSVIMSLGKMLRRLVGEDIEVELETHPALWPVKMDTGQLEQVVLNLVINARDAMPKGGRLTLTTRNLTARKDRSPDPGVDLPPGQYVCLEVRDTGVGIDEAARAHIFEPFFTTKEPGRGTGLGLSTVMGIVKHYRGFISLQSAPGHGTVFRVYLPRVEGGVQALVPGDVPKAVRGGHETILVVEDNDALRAIIKKALREKGYRVFSARSAEDAVALSGRLKERIELLLADVVLPDLEGPELAKRLAASRPELRVLFMSGYPGGVGAQGTLGQEAPLIEKPFSPEQLLGFVRRALDASQVEMF